MKYKVGDVIYIEKDLALGHGQNFIHKFGVIINIIDETTNKDLEIGEEEYPYHVMFVDGQVWYYCDEEIRLATEDESDKFFLERYKYV